MSGNFAGLARRMTNFTSNLLASAAVLLVALVVGREVLRWQRTGAPDRPNDSTLLATAKLGELDALHAIDVGDLPGRLYRKSVRGSTQSVQTQLRQFCQQTAASAPAPTGPCTDAERRLLARLATSKPAEESATERIYQFSGAMPLAAVVGTIAANETQRATDDAKRAPAANSSPTQTSVPPAQRIVAWGIAAQTSNDEWTLAAFVPAAGQTSEDTLAIRLPPGARRLLRVQDDQGVGVLLFAGAGPNDEYRRFFDQQLAEPGAATAATWAQTGNCWSARYNQKTESNATRAVEIQIVDQPDGRCIGLIWTRR